MDANSNRVNEGTERALTQAGAQLASIEDLVTCLEHAESCDTVDCGADCLHDVTEARKAITDGALSVEVRTDWHVPGADNMAKPDEYKILLCWGGPEVQIIGDLNVHNEPVTAFLEYRDWLKTWETYPLTGTEERTLMKYAQQFYFDE
jgi:hypothetical protein